MSHFIDHSIISDSMEMPALLKGNFHRHSLISYWLATTLADMISQVIGTVHSSLNREDKNVFVIQLLVFCFQTLFCGGYVSIVYYLTFQPQEAFRFVMVLAGCLLTAFIAQSIGLVIASAMHMQNQKFLAIAMSVIFVLTSGAFISFRAIALIPQLISYLSFGRHGFEICVLYIYGWRDGEKMPCNSFYCHYRNANNILDELNMSVTSAIIVFVSLIATFVLIRIFGLISLKLKLRSAK